MRYRLTGNTFTQIFNIFFKDDEFFLNYFLASFDKISKIPKVLISNTKSG